MPRPPSERAMSGLGPKAVGMAQETGSRCASKGVSLHVHSEDSSSSSTTGLAEVLLCPVGMARLAGAREGRGGHRCTDVREVSESHSGHTGLG